MNLLENFNTKTFNFVNYVYLTEKQSYTIWEGRNHPEVRKWMTDSEPFTWESHQKYVDGLKNRTDRSYWAAFYNHQIIGSMCLNPIGTNPPEYYLDNSFWGKWAETGMFLLPSYIGQGFGTKIKKEFVEYILSQTDIKTLFLKTQHANVRVIKLNESLGYRIFNKDESFVYMLKTIENNRKQ